MSLHEQIEIKLLNLKEMIMRENLKASFKVSELNYSYGFRVSFYRNEKLINTWEISEKIEDSEKELLEVWSYCQGYLDAIYTVRNNL